jgi:hypothetical protein
MITARSSTLDCGTAEPSGQSHTILILACSDSADMLLQKNECSLSWRQKDESRRSWKSCEEDVGCCQACSAVWSPLRQIQEEAG